MTATELIITKGEAPAEKSCANAIWEDPAKIINDMQNATMGLRPISMAITP